MWDAAIRHVRSMSKQASRLINTWTHRRELVDRGDMLLIDTKGTKLQGLIQHMSNQRLCFVREGVVQPNSNSHQVADIGPIAKCFRMQINCCSVVVSFIYSICDCLQVMCQFFMTSWSAVAVVSASGVRAGDPTFWRLRPTSSG